MLSLQATVQDMTAKQPGCVGPKTPHTTPQVKYLRKVSKKQTTYSMSMTQEGATNPCDPQLKEKSEPKLFLCFMDMKRARSHTHSQLLASLLISPVLPDN